MTNVLQDTCMRVIGAFHDITRRTGIEPEGFVVVMHPQRWYEMAWDDSVVNRWQGQGGPTGLTLRGMPVVLETEIAPERIILRAEVEA